MAQTWQRVEKDVPKILQVDWQHCSAQISVTGKNIYVGWLKFDLFLGPIRCMLLKLQFKGSFMLANILKCHLQA